MRTRQESRGRIALLAGWLFADLLAMLFVIGLSTVQGHPAASASHHVRPTLGPSPSPNSSAHPIGLDPHFIKIAITSIDYGALQSQGINGAVGRDIVRQVTRKIRSKHGGTRPVGFVVTFADAPETPANIAIADTVAVLVDKTLFAHQPQFFGCQQQTGWQGAPIEGTVSLKIFFDNT